MPTMVNDSTIYSKGIVDKILDNTLDMDTLSYHK
jgi:hypothetical protein